MVYSSARHSINFVGDLEDDEVRVDENMDNFSSSERTATITAEMSYASFGHSLIVCRRACNYDVRFAV